MSNPISSTLHRFAQLRTLGGLYGSRVDRFCQRRNGWSISRQFGPACYVLGKSNKEMADSSVSRAIPSKHTFNTSSAKSESPADSKRLSIFSRDAGHRNL